MKTFVLIGAAGYIAPRHMHAIQEIGGELVAALDLSDSVGVLDRFFPQAAFFTEFERFDRFLDKLRRAGKRVDFVSICSPNYLHDAHIRFALRNGSDVICEKPVVLNSRNFHPLHQIELETGRKVYPILQLRLHPIAEKLRALVAHHSSSEVCHIDLIYVTPRGCWYDYSWKGDPAKSGGVITNIGIHLFDLLIYVLGEPMAMTLEVHDARKARGTLMFSKAQVTWFLSLDVHDLPNSNSRSAVASSLRPESYRALSVNGDVVDFSDGFTDLHTECYRRIISGEGTHLMDAEPSLKLVSDLRSVSACR